MITSPLEGDEGGVINKKNIPLTLPPKRDRLFKGANIYKTRTNGNDTI
jgi:hypothetical protein